MILDTSFIIEVLDGNKNAVEKLKQLEDKQEKLSSITVMELQEGVVRSDKPEEERKQVLEILNSKNILSADRKIMKKAGEISGKLANKGKRIDREDCIIAATAILKQEPVITGNKKHFKRIENLELESIK